ncbi:fasciclin-like arabinogalactan protein 21 [Rhododendron vialii]|uniref:fasciclin-like arabinogalactan protein 21 n=1 Tax=Rhododendron vialii TaxID=182163 RepID=UPI00265E24A4|nr:fasciclin-like arabinogalactan protein 21 [Rhododendron vialii]
MSAPPLQLSFLLTSIIIFIFISTATATTPIPHLPPPPPHSSSDLFAPILAQLGFRELASAAHSLSTTTATPSWHGPATIFAPTDSSLLTCPSCSLPLLLQEHTLPGLYSLPFLLTLPFATKIQTLAPSPLCLTISSDHKNHPKNPKLFVNGVEITRPDLYADRNVVVHGIQGFVSHLSPLSCVIERTTSLSFPPAPPVAEFHLMASMLDDAMLRLRISGFSILALALKMKHSELLELRSMTLFAVNDVGIFADDDGGQSFVENLRMHAVPDMRLAAADLESLAAGTVLPTMEWGESLVVTTAGGGGPLAPMRINYVKVARPDLVSNLKIVIHGLAVPFERVNQTDAVGLARIGRCGFNGVGSEVEGKGGVCEKVGPVSGKEPTVEIEGRHGL